MHFPVKQPFVCVLAMSKRVKFSNQDDVIDAKEAVDAINGEEQAEKDSDNEDEEGDGEDMTEEGGSEDEGEGPRVWDRMNGHTRKTFLLPRRLDFTSSNVCAVSWSRAQEAEDLRRGR
jgi:hypothetical protein